MSGSEDSRERARGPHQPRPSRRGRAALVTDGGGPDEVARTAATDAPGRDETPPGKVSPARRTRFVSLTELARVADEAADIDSIVRSEVQRLGHPELVQEPQAFADVQVEPAARRHRRETRFVLILILALALIVATGLSAVVISSVRTGRIGSTEPSPSVGPRAIGPATPHRSPTPPSVLSTIRARLSILAPCWVQAIADGDPVFTGTLTGGARTFRAHRSLLITLGNAGGVRLVVNGRAVTTGSPGEVVDLSFVLKAGRLAQLP